MQSATVAYGAIVVSNEVTRAIRVTINWPANVPVAYKTLSGDKAVIRCDVLRETQTDQPLGTRYVTGRAASSCNLTLGGLLDPTDDTKTIAWLMGGYQSTSPMYRNDCTGIAVTVEEGILTGGSSLTAPNFEGVEFVTVMTNGKIDDYLVHPVTGTVDITVIDGRANLTTVPTLPPVSTIQPFNSQLTAEWPIDRLARSGGYYTWPATRSNCVLAAGMRGSFWPEVGSVDVNTPTTVSGPPALVTGKYGSALTGATVIYDLAAPINASSFFCEYITQFGTGGSVTVDVMDGPGSFIHDFQLYTTGVLAFFDGTTTFTYTLTTPSSGFHYVSAQVTGTVLKLGIDGVTQTFTCAPAASSYGWAEVSVTTATVEALQITTESAAALNNGFAPNAVIDPSLNLLTALPDVAGQDAWQVLQDIATAEQGVVGIDELGVFRFTNRHNIGAGASVRTFDADSSLISLELLTSKANSANHVQVPVNVLKIGPPTFVWSASTAIAVPAHGSWTQTISTGSTVIQLATADSGEEPATGAVAGKTYWRACAAANGSGARITTGIAVTCVQNGPTSITVTVTNSNGFTAYLVTPIGVGFPTASNGLPCLDIGGRFVTASATAVDGTVSTPNGVMVEAKSAPAIARVGETLLVLPANDWRQDVSSAATLAGEMLAMLVNPNPAWQMVTTFDPRIQRGDRITVNDPNISGISNEDAVVQTIDAQDETWTMTVTARPVYRPGTWRLGVAGFAELGVTTYI